MLHTLRALRSDLDGSAAVMLALAAPAMIGASALAMDLGSLYLAERNLQGVADAAAAAAVSGHIGQNSQTAAKRAIEANRLSDVTIRQFDTGQYQRDPSIPIDDRFVPGAADPNAARIELVQDVPLFFGSFLSGSTSSQVVAQATAARLDLISFDLGSKLISVQPGLTNAILSQLAGAGLDLRDGDLSSLADTTIDVVAFVDQLRQMEGASDATFADVLDAQTPLNTAIQAMAQACNDPTTRAVLQHIADSVGNDPVTVSDLIDLGPYRSASSGDGKARIEVDAYSLLRGLLEVSHTDGYSITLDVSAAGLASAKLMIAGGRSYQRSPWLTLTSAYDVVLRTVQTRIGLIADVNSGVSQIGNIHLPIYAQLAPAEARLDSINCSANRDQNLATLAVTPSLADVGIEDLTGGDFYDLQDELSFSRANMVNLPLVKVNGYADMQLGGSHSQKVTFTMDDIDNLRRKTVGTDDITQSAAHSLVNGVNLRASVAGLGLSVQPVTSAVGTALSTVAPTIDGIINQATQALGVQLGVAETGVLTLRCGRPTIVA